MMEEIREEKVSQILSWLQAAARGKMSRQTYKKLQAQKVHIKKCIISRALFNWSHILQMALYCIQRTIRNFMIGKTWAWWQLWHNLKPNLRSAKFAEIKVMNCFLVHFGSCRSWFLFTGFPRVKDPRGRKENSYGKARQNQGLDH